MTPPKQRNDHSGPEDAESYEPTGHPLDQSLASVDVSNLEEDLDEKVLGERAPHLLSARTNEEQPVGDDRQGLPSEFPDPKSSTSRAPIVPTGHSQDVSNASVSVSNLEEDLDEKVLAVRAPHLLSMRAMEKKPKGDDLSGYATELTDFEAIHERRRKNPNAIADDRARSRAPDFLRQIPDEELHPDTKEDSKPPELNTNKIDRGEGTGRGEAADRRDVTSGIASNRMQWLAQVAKVDLATIASMTSSDTILESVIAAAKAQANEGVERFMPHNERDLEDIKGPLTWADVRHWGAMQASNSTAWTDMKHAGEFRDMLKKLEVTHNGETYNQLELIQSVFQALKAKIDDLGEGPDFDFVKNKANAGIDALLTNVGSTAYDQTGPDRWKSIAAAAATLMLSVAPFAYAANTNPTSWYYLGSLAGAYARTTALAIGMMAAGSITGTMLKDHVIERQAIWVLPAGFYSIQGYIIAYSLNNSENQQAKELAHEVEAFEKPSIAGIGFLVLVGVAEMLIFLSLQNKNATSQFVKGTWNAFKENAIGRAPSQDSRFVKGEMTVPETEENREQIESVRSHFKLGAGLLEIFSVASEKWENGSWSEEEKAILAKSRDGKTLTSDEKAILKRAKGKGEALSSAEKAILTQVRMSLANLSATLDLAVGGIAESIEMISKKQWEEKQKVTNWLLGVGAILGVVSSGAALRTPALLTDYIPYYISTELLLISQKRDDLHLSADVARTFGSYFGGTALAFAPALGNVLSLMFSAGTGKNEVLKGDGLFDIVSPSNTTTGRNPNTAVAKNPGIHAVDGKVNFAAFTIFCVLSTLWVGGKVGEAIAEKVIERMERSSSGEDAGASEQERNAHQNVDVEMVRRAINFFRSTIGSTQAKVMDEEDASRFEEIEMDKLGESSEQPQFVEGSSKKTEA